MSNWTSISVKEAQKDELNEAKDKANHNGSMGEFLVESVNGETNTESIEDMDFEDWFSPDYAQTIAHHIREELTEQSAEVDTDAIDELQDTLESMDIERIGQSMVQVNQLSEEIGRLQDQVNQLEKTLEGLR